MATDGGVALTSRPGSHPVFRTRRAASAAVILYALGIGPSSAQAAGTSDWKLERARASSDFVDSVGVVTHMTYQSTGYDLSPRLLKQRLLDAHIHHLRDGALSSHDGGFSPNDKAERFAEYGRAGIKTTFVFTVNASEFFVRRFPHRVEPAFEAYEGPNEYNLNPGGTGWSDTLRRWMPKFYRYVKQDPQTRDFPVIGPSLVIPDLANPYARLADQSAFLDEGNIHDYMGTGSPNVGWGGPGVPPCEDQRYATIDFWLCYVSALSGRKPVVATETGWGSAFGGFGHVGPTAQARNTVRLLFEHFSRGITRTFLYQLVDQGDDGFGDYGLLDASLHPKPAYTELRQLLGLLDEPPAATRMPALVWGMHGETENVHHLLLAKSDRTVILALWLDVPGWDLSANHGRGAPIETRSQKVILRLCGSPTGITQYSYDDNRASFERTTPTTSPSVTSLTSLRIEVRDSLTLLMLQNLPPEDSRRCLRLVE